MARRIDKHNRFADEPSTAPSRFEEMNFDGQLVERDRRRAGWLRNFAILAVLIAVALLVMMVAR
jgi:hypothetical protein